MRNAKRWMAAILVLVLMFPLVSLGEEKALKISWNGNASLGAGEIAYVIKTHVNETASGELTYTLTDTARNKMVYTESRSGVKAGDELTWPVVYDAEGLSSSKAAKRMRAAFSMDGKKYTYDFFYSYSKENGAVVLTVERAVWYPNNTACSFGPQFREISPSLTDKWYMFTPIDLSRQGRQEFEYAAGNMYIIGKVYVDVQGDLVTVSYENFCADQGGNTATVQEFFTFFSDLSAVNEVEPEQMETEGYEFGRPISIQNDLGGDTNVLLYVRNRVNYRDYVTNGQKLTRFWINHPDRVNLRNAMIRMMDGDWKAY